MRVVFSRLIHHSDLFSRHLDIETDLVHVAELVVPMGHVNDHSAAHDAVTELVELGCLFKNPILD
jgi:hypothetical protein